MGWGGVGWTATGLRQRRGSESEPWGSRLKPMEVQGHSNQTPHIPRAWWFTQKLELSTCGEAGVPMAEILTELNPM